MKKLINILLTILLTGIILTGCNKQADSAFTEKSDIYAQNSQSEESMTSENSSESDATDFTVTDTESYISETTTKATTPITSKQTVTTKSPAVTTVPIKTTAPPTTTVPIKTTTPAKTTTKAVTTTPKVTTPASSSSSNSSSFISEVVRLVNIERAKENLSALSESSELDGAANIRANEIITKFAHQRPDGREWHTVLAESGISYNASGENIAAGQRTPAEVVEGWMNSPGHRANIMNSSFNKIGVGYVTGGSYGHNWVQLFTN